MRISRLSKSKSLTLAVVFFAALAPRLATVGNFVTTDEWLWMNRAERFTHAMVDHDFHRASASLGELSTMPGVSTMWCGVWGHGLWSLGGAFGLWDSTELVPDENELVFGWVVADQQFATDRIALTLSQMVAALLNSTLVLLLFVVIARWLGEVPAWTCVILVATEPWIIGLGSILHTDSLVALFGTTGLISFCWALGVPDPTRQAKRPVIASIFAAALLIQAPLTKLTGLGFVVAAATVYAVAAYQRFRSDLGLQVVVRSAAVATSVMLISMAISWPAIFADFYGQFQILIESARLGTDGHLQYFLGEVTRSPPFYYYLVALPFRMTPWLLIGILVLVPVALAARKTRAAALIILIGLLPLALVLSLADKKFARYGVLLIIPLCMVVGLGASIVHEKFSEKVGRMVSRISASSMFIFSLTVAPYGLAYFNPLLGGGELAVKNLLVGWGEGVDLVAKEIANLEEGDCEGISVAGVGPAVFYGFPCLSPPSDGEPPGYVVEYVNYLQRFTPKQRAGALKGRELVAEIWLRGMLYAKIWR